MDGQTLSGALVKTVKKKIKAGPVTKSSRGPRFFSEGAPAKAVQKRPVRRVVTMAATERKRWSHFV